ncbi:AzlD domain-containing protein [Saccharopolyspora sp. HNM0986]|uniref:branched-chain amino acid transporter permease n=1 Tax=Saccharopolyspora galaxeae TaxID=2781241 RepID=UPI00190AF7A0|nr:AzlD domain-containing protein [Saccharopolyspora sp. HNM0986]MBK0867758.1 AzlD domain-containing protein [Saccharopolyspora sp. HNM0986]
MPDTGYLLAAVAVSAAVTWGLRALPFAALSQLRASPVVHFLSTRMPAGVMLILLVYSLPDLAPSEPSSLIPLVALAVTIGLHLWRRNPLLSILAGTVVHVVLASTLG